MPDRQTKDVRRDAAREKSRQLRESEKRRQRRNRVLLQGGIAVLVLAIVAVVALVITTAVRPAGPGPRNMADDGIVIGQDLKPQASGALAAGATPKQRAPQSGKVAIRAYEDFQCPACRSFEDTNAAQIKQLVQSGKATLQFYPVAILDRAPTSDYSTRSANAAACVADRSPDAFFEFHRLLYANQPPEGGSGRPDSDLIKYAKQAGATPMSAIQPCITGQTYKNWVGTATDRFTAGSFALTDTKNRSSASTPTVFVDGKLWDPDKVASFSAFLQQAGGGYVAPAPSPSPSPSSSGK